MSAAVSCNMTCPVRTDGGDHTISEGSTRCKLCGRNIVTHFRPAARNRLETNEHPKTQLSESQRLLRRLLDDTLPVPSRAELVHDQKKAVSYLAHVEMDLRNSEDMIAERDLELAILRRQLHNAESVIEKLQGDVRDMAVALEDQRWRNRPQTSVISLPPATFIPKVGAASLLSTRCLSEETLRDRFNKWDGGSGVVTLFQCLDVCTECGVATTLAGLESICARFHLGPKLTLDEVHLVAMKILNPYDE